jgi:hypothetical protein
MEAVMGKTHRRVSVEALESNVSRNLAWLEAYNRGTADALAGRPYRAKVATMDARAGYEQGYENGALDRQITVDSYPDLAEVGGVSMLMGDG